MTFSRIIMTLCSLMVCSLFLACDKDDDTMASTEGCTTVESDNYDPDADTDDGSCIPWRDKFTDTFDATRVDRAGAFPTQTGDLIITAGSGPLDITMQFRTSSWTAVITDKNTLEIPEQELTADLLISGSGTIDGDDISLTYVYAAKQSGGGSTTYDMTGTRK